MTDDFLMPITDSIANPLAWQADVVRQNQFDCKPIPVSESKDWGFEDRQPRDRTGGFFALAGFTTGARDPIDDRLMGLEIPFQHRHRR